MNPCKSTPTSEDYDRARKRDREQWHSTNLGGPAFCAGCWWCSGSFDEWAAIERQKSGRPEKEAG